ncbi:unnamed protein product [Spirodela intermedia]|uniref:Protein kinase domain-containing protein n=1 Tax=Spirodela intermedia TaxID=51605 RepID=A0A7I8L6U0_SPIIN|nr:unnamed protein product [Spirodela intermedia]
MEHRAEGQRSVQGPSNSNNANNRLLEVNELGSVRPVNFSIQTGEEFALEFMRDRANSRKVSTQLASGDQSNAAGYMDLRGILGISHGESESGSDVSLFASAEKGWATDLGNKSLLSSENKGHYKSAQSTQFTSSADGSNRGNPHGYASSGASDTFSSKKFLCSFGGKILPRPSDGKLRYVGGQTRMIRINKDISWQEFVQKISAIYTQAHTIKYQLPGEDLDALVSVSCDEDLQNMMEEYSVLDGGEGSQKLRIFLFSPGDFDDSQFGLGSMEGDSEIQYVVAVNGMDLGSGKISNGHDPLSMSTNKLDLLNLNSNDDKATKRSDLELFGAGGTPMVDTLTTQSSVSVPAGLPNDSKDQRIRLEEVQQCFPPNRNNAYDEVSNTNSRFPMPPSLPSDYDYMASYGPYGGASVAMPAHELPPPSKQGGATEDLYGSFQTEKEMSGKDAKLQVEATVPQKSEGEQIGSLDAELDTVHAHQHEELSSEHLRAEESYHSFFQEYKTIPMGSKVKGHSEPEGPERKLSPLESGNDSQIRGSNDGGLDASGEVQTSGFSPNETDVKDISHSDGPSRLFRIFHSETIPRGQSDLANRLSKSDDSIGSQFRIPHPHAGLPQQETISESLNQLHESNPVSQSEAATRKQSYLSVTTVEDGLLQFEKYKEMADAIVQTHQVETELANEDLNIASPTHLPMLPDNDLTDQSRRDSEEGMGVHGVQATVVQNESVGEGQSFTIGKKLQKSEFPNVILASSDEKGNANDDMIYLDGGTRIPLDSFMSDGASGKPKVQSEEPSIGKSESTVTTGIGNFSKKQDDHASSLSELHWGEISTASVYANDSRGQFLTTQFAWPGNSAGTVSQAESSGYDAKSQHRDICIDIDDRFPRDLLSDLFSKARITQDSSTMHTIRNDDIGLSLDMHNPEPKRWSFFRNLAQDEFNHTRKDVSLIDQDQIPYTSSLANVENVGHMTYEFSDREIFNASQLDFDGDIHGPSGNVSDAVSLSHIYMPTQAISHHNADKGDGVQTEIHLTPLSEYEDMKLDFGNIGGPAIDTSLGDIDLSNLQKIKNEDLEELRELGSGTFGTVYHGKWRGTDVAIKRIKKSCFTGRSSEQERLTVEFWREAEILSKLHHPNVVAFYGVVEDGPGGTLATVTEFMVNGSLRHVLLRNYRYLDPRKRLIIAMDAAIGMEYLHSKNIVHFDLKCDNLLVNLKDPQRPICKVGDFGLSKIKRNTLVSGGVRGTLPWMAPELLSGSSSKVSEKVDVFSFGIVMWEILTGEEPYANMHYGAIIGGIVSNTLRPPVPASCDPEWRRLMEQCWAPDPVQRPSFTEIAGRLRAMSVALQHKTHNAK